MQSLDMLEDMVGYHFKRKALLEQALTHTSYANAHNIASYERLEFLGDAVLTFLVATFIFRSHKEKDEAFLTDLKSAYVNRKFLQAVGERLSIQKFLRVVGLKDFRLDQAVEALIGAIFLDGGYRAAKGFVDRFILCRKVEPLADYKARLMSYVLEKFGKRIRYTVERESGPAHCKMFQVRVKVDGKPLLARAKAHSKKEAEMEASRILLGKLKAL